MLSKEEFLKALKLEYVFGMRRTDGASRKYCDNNMRVEAELHTPYDEDKHEWGDGVMTYYFQGSEKTHNNLDSLYEEYTEMESK